MPQRMIQLSVRDVNRDELTACCESAQIVSVVEDAWRKGLMQAHLLVSTEQSEAAMDSLQQAFGKQEDFQLSLLPLEAVLPRPTDSESDEEDRKKRASNRISREELYQEILLGLRVRSTFVAMVLLSTVVAAIGLYRDDTAILIGAMVIAPLLAPNVALAFAATLGDSALALRAVRINSLGVALSLVVAAAFGAALDVEPDAPAIAHRSAVNLGDVMLALASGAAGALAFTTGLPGALIGVMVAVALMPPLVAFGLLLGSGHLLASLNPLLLLASNVICLNLAAIATFMAKGIRPRTWWEAKRAKRATRWASFIWGALLAALLIILWYLGNGVI